MILVFNKIVSIYLSFKRDLKLKSRLSLQPLLEWMRYVGNLMYMVVVAVNVLGYSDL